MQTWENADNVKKKKPVKFWLNTRVKRDERKDLPAPHNNPIISLINDVMKANSVKIACKQLDLSLLMNSVSLLIKERGRGGGGEWVCGGVYLPLRKPVNTPKAPSTNEDLSLGTHVDGASLKTLLLSFPQVSSLCFRSQLCLFNPRYLCFTVHVFSTAAAHRFRVSCCISMLAQDAFTFLYHRAPHGSHKRTTF